MRTLLVIALGAVAVRLLVGALYNLDAESGRIRGYQFYLEMAENLVEGDGLRWSFYLGMGDKWANRPPLYPLLLAGILAAGLYPWGVLVIQALLGGGVALLAGAITARLAGRRAAPWASGLVAVYPYSVAADTTILEHSLYTLAVAVVGFVYLLLVRRRSLVCASALGVCCGLAVLVRITFALAVPPLLLGAWVSVRGRRGLLLAVASGLCVAATLAPWMIRNRARVGAPVLSSDTGRALWVGHNAVTLEIYPRESIDRVEWLAFRSLPAETRNEIRALGGDELAQSDLFLELALDYIRAHPGRTMRGALVKAWAFLSPELNPPTEPPAWKPVVHALAYLPLLLGGLAGFLILRRRWRELLFVPALVLGFLVPAALIWGQTRYRAPLDTFLAVGAAAAGARLARRRRPGEEVES